MRRPVVRLVDVAARAGVSVSTASRALSNPQRVSAATRARVEAAARAMRYRPNRMARGLITGRATAITVVIPDLTHTYFSVMCQAIQERARERDHDVYIVETGFDHAREREIVDFAAPWTAGIIFCNARLAHHGRLRGVPVVYMNRRSRRAHSVITDQRHTVRTQIEHLASLGHEHILWINGPKGVWASEERLRQVHRLAQTHDIRIGDDYNGGFAGGVEIADELDDDVTAIAMFNDRQAMGFLSRAAQLGISVPGDVSVIGSENFLESEYANPPLTTVHTPKEEMARAAVSLLLDHQDDRNSVIVEIMRGHLVTRATTAPPRIVSTPPPPAADASST